MAKIKLTESVSISELKHMREVEGLGNAEIAKRVGCAVSTVIVHIGKQPMEMTKRNQMAGMRKVKQEEPSTPVGEPTKHHESFADLVARVKAEAVVEKNKKELGLEEKTSEAANPVADDIVPVIVHGTMYDIPKVAYEVIKHEVLKNAAPAPVSYADSRAHINELLAVFGPDVVRQYLRVALYALGIPDSRQVRREHLLDALNTLNKEATCDD